MGYTRAGEPFANGSETSFEAALHARQFVSEQGVKVYRWLRERRDYGGTQKEAEAALAVARPSLCARFKALEDFKAIQQTSVKRDGCRVYVVTKTSPPAQLRLLVVL